MALIKRVEDLMKKALSANKSDIDEALIKPISPEWPFATNGVYFFVGKMGSGKSYYIWKHIYVTEQIQKGGYYQEIIFFTTSGKLDQTAEPLKKNVKTLIKHVKEKHLIAYLTKHLKWKAKYYSLCRHVLSQMKRTDEKMEQLIEKHSLQDIRDRSDYIAEKLCKYGTSEYPFRTLLVMDDFAASPLLEKVNSPISKFLTKTRHYHLTAIIVAQTWRFIILNLKRLATDVVAYAHFSEEDFTKILKQTANDCDINGTIAEYRSLTGEHDHFVMNITANRYYFVRPDAPQGQSVPPSSTDRNKRTEGNAHNSPQPAPVPRGSSKRPV